MFQIGLDLGSSYTKGVVINKTGEVVERLAIKTGYDFKKASQTIIDAFSRKYQVDYPVFSCGYGRDQIEAPFVPHSEIIALAKAVFEVVGREGNVLDIGGQDTKYVKVSSRGLVDRFKLNRKCAAGTGAFIEEIAFRLGVPVLQFDEIAKEADKEIEISSFCTVFAISEIVGLLKSGASLPSIIKGVYRSVVKRASEMGPLEKGVILTGGVPAKHPMIMTLLREKGVSVECPEHAQFLAAMGTVLLGKEK